MEPSDELAGLWPKIGVALTGIAIGIRWWYHTRKLENVDKVDGSVTKSISFVLAEMRQEMQRLRQENKELRAEIAELRASAVTVSRRVSTNESSIIALEVPKP